MRFKNALKRFAYETFRPHSKEEYAELFSRGHGGNEKTPYPWFYARVLLISLLLFTVLCVGFSLSKLNFVLVLVAGGIFADLTFIILLVEIYPERDLPLLTPILAMFAGGILSSAIIYILYGITSVNLPFADQAWTAFVEETGKALTTIIILLIVKKRNPCACFIIGAAVGGGYSAFENVWRMYTQGYYSGGLSGAIDIGLWRALGTPFSHAAWAGIFGWALAEEKPWRSWKPYAAYTFGYVMHFFVNFPEMPQFKVWYGYAISAVTGVLSIVLIIYLIFKTRRDLIGYRASLPELPHYGQPQISEAYPKINGVSVYAQAGVQPSPVSERVSKYRFIANVLAAAAIFCFSFTLLGPTYVFGGYSIGRATVYQKWQDALSMLQYGLNLNPDYEREYIEYDDLSQNYAYTWTDGELISATQREQIGANYFRYTYGYTVYGITFFEKFEDADGNLFVTINDKDIPVEVIGGKPADTVRVWELRSVGVEFGDSIYYSRTLIDYSQNYSEDSESISHTAYRYFKLNSSVLDVHMNLDGTYEVVFRESVPIRMTESIVFSSIFFAAFVGCGVAYLVYKKRINSV